MTTEVRCVCNKLLYDGLTGRHTRSYQTPPHLPVGVLSVKCQCGRFHLVDLRGSRSRAQTKHTFSAAPA